MNAINNEHQEETVEVVVPAIKDLGWVANDICEKALNDAKEQLHPLIRNSDLGYLRRRSEFMQAFKLALEKRIAQTLAVWQPNVQAVFKFDESWMENRDKSWDGSIHLLVKVPRLSNAIKMIGKRLDQSLTRCLKRLGWSHFLKHQSILEIQQVTANELRHGVSYGAMFYAVYSVPVKVWPIKRQTR
jgi:hypothetical protein